MPTKARYKNIAEAMQWLLKQPIGKYAKVRINGDSVDCLRKAARDFANRRWIPIKTLQENGWLYIRREAE